MDHFKYCRAKKSHATLANAALPEKRPKFGDLSRPNLVCIVLSFDKNYILDLL